MCPLALLAFSHKGFQQHRYEQQLFLFNFFFPVHMSPCSSIGTHLRLNLRQVHRTKGTKEDLKTSFQSARLPSCSKMCALLCGSFYRQRLSVSPVDLKWQCVDRDWFGCQQFHTIMSHLRNERKALITEITPRRSAGPIFFLFSFFGYQTS